MLVVLGHHQLVVIVHHPLGSIWKYPRDYFALLFEVLVAEEHNRCGIAGSSHRSSLSIDELRSFQMVDFFVETFIKKCT
jgi:hypothetical protein